MSYTETQDPVEVVCLADIKYFDHGMGFSHNMPCCVYPDNEPAVLDCDMGVFTPSWAAQRDGWALVRYNQKPSWWARFLFWLIRHEIYKYPK